MESSPSSSNPMNDGSAPAKLSPKSMIAWWGLIPAIIYVVIQVIFGWSEAKLRASSPQFASSYLIGTILGGLLMTLVITWIVFRLSRRSTNAATITFSIILGLSCLNRFSNPHLHRSSNSSLSQSPAMTTAISTSTDAPNALVHPDYPVVMTVPDGWEIVPDVPAPILFATGEPATGSTLGLIGIRIRDEKFTLNRKDAEAGLMKELGPRATILHRIETTFLDLPAYCIICRTEVEGVRMSAARIMVEKPLQGIGYAVQFSKVGSEDISPNFIPSILKRFQMKK